MLWPLARVSGNKIDVVGKGKTVRSHVNIVMRDSDRVASDPLGNIERSLVLDVLM
jgi:hypothetical protein